MKCGPVDADTTARSTEHANKSMTQFLTYQNVLESVTVSVNADLWKPDPKDDLASNHQTPIPQNPSDDSPDGTQSKGALVG